jgi:hypothetical protein
MRRSSPREAVRLSGSVQQQLNMYALAATAAGVGVLALAQPSEARIIYTPAHHRIGPNQTYEIDLNHDGKPDFRVVNRSVTYGISAGAVLQVVPTNHQNGVVGYGYINISHSIWASALPTGAPVGPKRHFAYASSHGSQGPLMTGFVFEYKSHQCKGPWDNVIGYLGMKFIIQGKFHFGWARLKVSCSPQVGGVTALLTGYAYETIANKPIVTGKTSGPDGVIEPATLGHLAAGSSGRAVQIVNKP